MAEDRHGVAPLDDALNHPEATQKRNAINGKFHHDFLRCYYSSLLKILNFKKIVIVEEPVDLLIHPLNRFAARTFRADKRVVDGIIADR
jgi:hypothetical protein